MRSFNFFPTSPKKEEQQLVPDLASHGPTHHDHQPSDENESIIIRDHSYNSIGDDEEIGIMDELEDIWGIEDEEKMLKGHHDGNIINYGVFGRDFMDYFDDNLPNIEDEEYYEEYEEKEGFDEVKMMKTTFGDDDDDDDEKQGHYNYASVGHDVPIKREICGIWDDEEPGKNISLNLNLNYQEVMDAWSDRGSLWAEDCSLSINNSNFMGEVPVMQEERTRREARVLRYKEKRQSRLFSKKIRYQVRKINAEKRPRLKGRFVKRVPDKIR
ncbi:hypothetical protein Scep_005753 [Stephania cephalantha]|uniref:CCT domain-containing protein n=1 Tax=Stephania cephalantha TaxID=152367 RepID=A0AAP0KY22_9MAGN